MKQIITKKIYRLTCNVKTRRALVFACSVLSLVYITACNFAARDNTSTVATASPTPNAPPRTAFPFPPPKPKTPGSRVNTIEKSWTTVEGKSLKLSDFGGKVVVLDFYATWCPPCREEVPHLIALQGRYASKGLQIVGLNVGGEEDRPKVSAFAKDFGITYQLGNPDYAMVELFFSDDDTIPQTYVFDKHGKLLQRFIGYDSTMKDRIEGLVKSALADERTEVGSKQ
ncbi:MAG: hypothetical protein NVSMB56_18680 [Pyrinomonadaceae bacterium]